MTASPADLGARARGVAERLVPVVAQFESICFDAGARLGDAVPRLAALSQSFASVSELLEGPQMTAASQDLRVIAGELQRASVNIDEEERSLAELVKLNRKIGRQVESLEANVRTVSALVFTLKIEAAQLPQHSADMVEFAKTLQTLTEGARTSLENYRATQMRLEATLRASAAMLAEFKRRHQAELASIAGEVLESLDSVADRRSQAVGALAEVGRRSRDVGDRIGDCVTGLQIGDATRQRVEHVAAALRGAADALGHAPPGFAGEPRGLAARLAFLQRRQLEEAHVEFERETQRIASALATLGGDARELEAQGFLLFGVGGESGGSFLESIALKLAQARDLVEAGRATRTSVDEATSSVAATMADLQSRTRGLVGIAADVTMIGTNASLRSARLGEAGKGVTLVAAELRGFGRQIHAGIQQLPPALARVLEFVDRFAVAKAELDADRLARLDQRMQAAITIFRGGGEQMSVALRKLGDEAAESRARLEEAAEALARQADAGPRLVEAANAIAEIVDALGGGHATSEEIDQFLDETLQPTYTMASERRIHAALTGAGAESFAEAPAPRAQAEAEAFML